MGIAASVIQMGTPPIPARLVTRGARRREIREEAGATELSTTLGGRQWLFADGLQLERHRQGDFVRCTI